MGDVTFPLEPMYARTQSVCNLDHALLAGEAWEAFLESPGPVVVGTAQGGSCVGASYEFLFNIKHRASRNPDSKTSRP